MFPVWLPIPALGFGRYGRFLVWAVLLFGLPQIHGATPTNDVWSGATTLPPGIVRWTTRLEGATTNEGPLSYPGDWSGAPSLWWKVTAVADTYSFGIKGGDANSPGNVTLYEELRGPAEGQIFMVTAWGLSQFGRHYMRTAVLGTPEGGAYRGQAVVTEYSGRAIYVRVSGTPGVEYQLYAIPSDAQILNVGTATDPILEVESTTPIDRVCWRLSYLPSTCVETAPFRFKPGVPTDLCCGDIPASAIIYTDRREPTFVETAKAFTILPPNDEILHAKPFAREVSGSTSGGTFSNAPGDQVAAWVYPKSGSCWYRWRAPLSGTAEICIAGSQVNRVFVLNTLQFDVDGEGRRTFQAEKGKAYYISVIGRTHEGPFGDFGNGFYLSVALTVPMPSIELSSPQGGVAYLSGTEIPVEGVGEPLGVAIESMVLTGGEASIGTARLEDGRLSGRINTWITGDLSIHFSRDVGLISLINWREFPLRVMPSNDAFVDRKYIGLGTTNWTAGLAGTTREALENRSPNGGSVWWTWRAPSAGEVRLSSGGWPGGTTLSLFSGNSLPGLKSLVSSKGPGSPFARVNPGEDYVVLGEAEQVALIANFGIEFIPTPTNDRPSGATLACSQCDAQIALMGSTFDRDEPQLGPTNQQHSVWFSWKARFNGRLELVTSVYGLRPVESAFFVRDDDGNPRLPPLGTAVGAPNSLLADVRGGSRYLIRVADLGEGMPATGKFFFWATPAPIQLKVAVSAGDLAKAAVKVSGSGGREVELQGSDDLQVWQVLTQRTWPDLADEVHFEGVLPSPADHRFLRAVAHE